MCGSSQWFADEMDTYTYAMCYMLETFLAMLDGNRSKRGYENTHSCVYGEHVLPSYITSCGDCNLVTAMFSLCRTLDLLQNGGITSGNDILVAFRILHVSAKRLEMKLMDKKCFGCFRNTLAACFAFASEFGRFWCNFVFLDGMMMFFNNWFAWFSTTN